MRWKLGFAGLATGWGAIAVLVGAVSLGAVPLAFLRLSLAAATLAVVAIAVGRRGRLRPGAHLRPLITLGVVQALHWWLFFEAVKRGSVALAVLTFYTAPLFLAALAPLFLRERLSRVVLAAFVPGAVGIVLVALAGDSEGSFGGFAVTAGIGSALSFAILVVLSKRLLEARVAPLTVAFWDCLVGGIAIAPALLLTDRVVPVDGGEWAVALLLGIVFTGFATLVYAALLRHVTAQVAGVLTFLEPVAAVVLAWLLLGESLGPTAIAGALLVLLAGILVVVLEPSDQLISEAVAAVGSPAEP